MVHRLPGWMDGHGQDRMGDGEEPHNGQRHCAHHHFPSLWTSEHGLIRHSTRRALRGVRAASSAASASFDTSAVALDHTHAYHRLQRHTFPGPGCLDHTWTPIESPRPALSLHVWCLWRCPSTFGAASPLLALSLPPSTAVPPPS